MSDFQQIRQQFEPAERKGFTSSDHVVINVEQPADEPRDNRRISLKTLEWLTGKVETLRRKFSAATLEYTTEKREKDYAKSKTATKLIHNGTRKGSESDGDLVEIGRKYQICGTNKYTWIAEEFETIAVVYSRLMQENQIRIHRDCDFEPPRGILLMPMSSGTGQALLDFSEMGGYSLGRGSRVAKMATRALSRTHCMIYLENNSVHIRDCDSKTGTFVNGRLLGSSVPTRLENFDIIQMGYGSDYNDFIQSMVIFLDTWNPKEFASCIQQMSALNMQSRTFSNSVSELMLSRGPEERIEKRKDNSVASPLVSSPKMTQIGERTGKSKQEAEVIVFERPAPLETYMESNFNCNRQAFELPATQKIAVPVEPDQEKRRQMDEQTSINRQPIESSTVNIVMPSKSTKEIIHEQYETLYSPAIREPVDRIAPEVPKQRLRSPRDEECAEAPKIQTNKQYVREIEEQYNMLREEDSLTASPRHLTASSRIEADLLKPSITLTSSPRPPVPKPRRTKKNLSKSADCLVEVELEEIVEEVERRIASSVVSSIASSPIVSSKVVGAKIEKIPIAKNTAQKAQISNVAVPDFLKSENMKIPTTSPAQELLNSAKMMETCNKQSKKKLNLPVNKKRSERVEKLRREAQFVTIVQGANTKRFENFVDFGTATSDISDGLAESHLNKKQSLQVAFNNFRVTWVLESLNRSCGTKLVIQAVNKNNYELSIEGRTEASLLKIGTIEMDLKDKLMMKIVFKIEDSVFDKLTNTNNNDSKDSLPLKALDQLTYFYPHLEIPSVVIQGPVTDKVNISLLTSKASQPVGKIVFEGQKVSWSKRQMHFALDLDESAVEIDSLLCDTIQSAALLYCLRYHID